MSYELERERMVGWYARDEIGGRVQLRYSPKLARPLRWYWWVATLTLLTLSCT